MVYHHRGERKHESCAPTRPGRDGVPSGVKYPSPPVTSGNLNPSLPLFWKLMTDRCLEPDVAYAWELNKGVTQKEWWGELPTELRAKIEFFEVGIDEGSLEEVLANKYRAKARGKSFIQVGAPVG